MQSQSRRSASQLAVLVPEGGTAENPFPIPAEIVDHDFIQGAPAGDKGRARVRQHREALFLRAHGQARDLLAKTAASLERRCARLEAECDRARAVVAATDQKIVSLRPSLAAPSGRDRLATVWWGLVLVALAGFTWVNAARFAANETQDWLLGFLYAAPLLFVPFGLKFIDEKLTTDVRFFYWIALVFAFTASLALFYVSFAWHFGHPVVVDSTANLAGGSDLRGQLLGQLILDPLLALAAYSKFRESLQTGAREVKNPDWEARMREAVRLEDELLAASRELGQHTGLLLQLEKVMEAYADEGEARWQRIQDERAQAEREWKEEDLLFEERQRQLRERQANRRQALGVAPTPPANGKILKMK
jgi:hypothetical protein